MYRKQRVHKEKGKEGPRTCLQCPPSKQVPPTVSTNPLNRTASQGPIFSMSASEAGAYRIQTITTNLEPHGDWGGTCDIIGNAYRFQVSLGDRAGGTGLETLCPHSYMISGAEIQKVVVVMVPAPPTTSTETSPCPQILTNVL